MKHTSPHAIVVGAGFTGCAVAHDLALRGVAVTIVERGDIASGTSGRTHGLLHSGGRYCVNNRESAIECIEEMPFCAILLRNVSSPTADCSLRSTRATSITPSRSCAAPRHVASPSSS